METILNGYDPEDYAERISPQLDHTNHTYFNYHEATSDNTTLVQTAMDTYLKRHKLDLTLLPNKKIKLSDLTHNTLNNTQVSIKSTSILFNNSSTDNSISDTLQQQIPQLINNPVSDFSGSEENEEENELDTTEESEQINSSMPNNNNQVVVDVQVNATTSTTDTKRSRKKREPSLKLQQKLSNDDLELIVNSVRNRNANVSIADVKKDTYIDKILKVELLNTEIVLSNGKNEALLKKSMFPKELNTLFDTFVNALCAQKHLIDENGSIKPTLTCLVVECGYKSFSEAEIIRHIKRHLAQDGYTCSTCSHQFASMTNLQRHLRIHAGNVGKEMKCPECDYKASTITHVKRHMAHKHLERALPCPHCSFMGATNAELKIHMARKHLELTGKNPLFLPKYLRKDYQCNICKEQYNDFKEYQAHMYEHTSSSNRFQCTECPYNCKNYSKLKRHMLYHTGARNYSCELCGNKFFQMEHLKRHMQSIHNIITQTTSSNNSGQPSGQPKSVKQTSSKKQPTRKSNQSNIVRQGPIITTISDEKISSTLASSSYNQLRENCFRISSRCMYKCQQCEFSTVKLYNLNEHMISKHPRSQDLLSQANSDSFLSDELDMSEYRNDEDDTSSEFDFEDDNQSFNENNSNEQVLNEYYFCSFCAYKTDKKSNLKQHLYTNHTTSQNTAPILLSNDSIITGPNTRFLCSTCQSYLGNINDYTKHMNEKHNILVYILDMNGESSIQDQLQSKGRAEIISTSSFHDSFRPQPNTQPSNFSNKNLNQRQQLKNFINSSNNLQLRHQQHHTTVRINPMIFKQQNMSSIKPHATQQSQPVPQQHQQQQQQCNLLNSSVSQQLISDDLGMTYNHGAGQSIFNTMGYSKNVDLDFDSLPLNEAADQLGIIVNEFQ